MSSNRAQATDGGYWRPGTHIVLREVMHQRVWTVRPVIVVSDEPGLIVLYMMPGTIYKHPRRLDRDEVPLLLENTSWRLIDVAWTGGGALYLSRPGEHYTVMAFWKDDQTTLNCWYVNLQTPFCRTPLGFDYLDQELDVVVSPDLSEWHWKDEEKFDGLVEKRLIPEDRAAYLWNLGEQVIVTRYDDGSLFRLGWDRWPPPSAWRVPTIPDNWDVRQ